MLIYRLARQVHSNEYPFGCGPFITGISNELGEKEYYIFWKHMNKLPAPAREKAGNIALYFNYKYHLGCKDMQQLSCWFPRSMYAMIEALGLSLYTIEAELDFRRNVLFGEYQVAFRHGIIVSIEDLHIDHLLNVN